MSNKRMCVLYTGRVQGVGFRFTAERFALELGLVGWVMNLPDGRVEVACEGEEAKLRKLLQKIDGVFCHYIKDISLEWLQPTGEFGDFEIKFY